MKGKRVPADVRLRIRSMAGDRCGYCLAPQRLLPWKLEIEHIRPSVRGGGDEDENLWLSCRSCNSFKGPQTHAHDPVTNRTVLLFNPRRQKWSRHFKWSRDRTQVIGLTASGRATVVALKLNNMFSVTARREWALAVSPPTRASSNEFLDMLQRVR